MALLYFWTLKFFVLETGRFRLPYMHHGFFGDLERYLIVLITQTVFREKSMKGHAVPVGIAK